MIVRQFYTDCLNEAAYYIESEGVAAVIDPLRDTRMYLETAANNQAAIRYIFETHFHADFISGHLDLHQQTGATIVFGPEAEAAYPAHIAKDGESFQIGACTLRVLHTPGHTIESACYLLYDEQNRPYCLFSGDTLFTGDVGRPDLSSGDLGAEELAGLLYESLQKKIMPLPDEVILYPAHDPGNTSGKQTGCKQATTVGEEKKKNYALQLADKAGFVAEMTRELTTPPAYFFNNARINRDGYPSFDQILHVGLTPLAVEKFRELAGRDEDFLVLDTRTAADFMEGFIPGAVFIGLEGRFAEWAANILPSDRQLLLVSYPGKETESITRLARIGLDKVAGYLEGSFPAWEHAGYPLDMVINIDADELAMDLPYDEKLVVLDVRKEAEFADGHVKAAKNIPLEWMKDPGSLAELEESDNLYVHCGSGYRSLIAASLLKKQGFHNLRNVSGGWNAIRKEKNIRTEKEASALN
jgi:glyoxylase-like metal-dependent hydrolase (beta-lactamase superfamily II)/rhodanese-related sulfurtransferase